MAKIAAERPDLVKLGEFAGQYGFVMNGGTSANALSVYELQAKEFTGYWSGEQSLDDALPNTAGRHGGAAEVAAGPRRHDRHPDGMGAARHADDAVPAPVPRLPALVNLIYCVSEVSFETLRSPGSRASATTSRRSPTRNSGGRLVLAPLRR